MNLNTKYLGLELKNPLVPSASPMMQSLDNIELLASAGASAVVLHSLFEEQISEEALSLHYLTTQGTESFAESLSYFPEPEEYKFGGEEYLEHIRKVKESVNIPVIGSLNGVTTGGWLQYAKHMEEAGADAIELNVYYISTDPSVNDDQLLENYVSIVKEIKKNVGIPVAVKLSPFFTSLPATIRELSDVGADGFVLFNRFYQPDIDIENKEIKLGIQLTESADIRLPLRWIGVLYGRIDTCFAATSGVHTAEDSAKLIMAGADVTMMASALLKNGPGYLKTVLDNLAQWMEQNEYTSIEEMKGSMSQKAVPNPAAYERALYIKELQSYRK